MKGDGIVMRGLLVVVLMGIALVLGPSVAVAHPLGNFTVNEYSRLDVMRDAVRVHFVLDMAEIPAFQERQAMDTNADGTVSDAESAAYLAKQIPRLIAGTKLKVAGHPATLTEVARSITFPPGQGGLRTLRVSLDLRAPFSATSRPTAIDYWASDFPDRIGWREIIIVPGAGVSLSGANVPLHDQSGELRRYPTDMLAGPLDVRSAHASAALGGSGAAGGAALPNGATVPASARVPDQFSNLIVSGDLSPGVVVTAFLLAILLGAGHALTPGHGKTIVGAYLVGARGTARHAVFLGLTTAATHTSGVFLIGFVTLWLSGRVLPEQLYPWIEFASGVLVIIIGASLLANRLRSLRRARGADEADSAEHAHAHAHAHDQAHRHAHDHDHGHNHGHIHEHVIPGADGQPVTWRGLILLGISGGMLPCPSALVVLLGAIALHRLAFGMLLIVAFSLGLAGVLIGVGLVLVRARGLFDRIPSSGRWVAVVPVASAAFVTVAGVFIAVAPLIKAGLVRL